jgi:hypothetical protein
MIDIIAVKGLYTRGLCYYSPRVKAQRERNFSLSLGMASLTVTHGDKQEGQTEKAQGPGDLPRVPINF